MNEASNATVPAAVEGTVTRLSPISVAQTLERLRSAIQAHKLTMFAHINHTAAAKQAGLAMQEAHVLIFGSPKTGTPLMMASPRLALELPLRALVWQSADGQVWVSSTRLEYIQVRYAIPATLITNLACVDALIEGVLHR